MCRLKKTKILLFSLIIGMLSLSACSNDKENKENADNKIISIGNEDTSDESINVNSDVNNNDEENVNSDNKDTDNTEDDNKVTETFLDEDDFVTNSESIDVVVNKERNLSSTYVPSDLTTLTDVPTCLANPEVNQLRKEAAEALTKLFKAANDELSIQLYARSGYRSYNTQVALYNGYVKNHGQEAADTFSAKPGQSEHQTGLAMDVTSDSVNLQLSEDFGDTKEGKWLCENAYKYGFIIRYQKGKEDITGYMYEPWHIRYLGTDLAKKVYDSGMTLEQYFFGENKDE